MTAQNRGLIGEGQLRKMKPTAYIINTARGALIDEAALLQALHENWIAGAALDAFLVEPLPAEHPLRKAPNVLLTPHLASFARETGKRVSYVRRRRLWIWSRAASRNLSLIQKSLVPLSCEPQ